MKKVAVRSHMGRQLVFCECHGLAEVRVGLYLVFSKGHDSMDRLSRVPGAEGVTQMAVDGINNYSWG